ncbi:uncharacterized protein LOC105739195 [Nomascus leucogenys]|uniref:uncharacterized protein LOC105739195 n=1 Tax=Nomascus leucogenys TaxID=61853 RepID=UPI00122D666F|nr:uncharacterized protein LOC105739195 [Nomascus leucogenys]
MSSEWAAPQNKKTHPLRTQCRYSSRILHSRTCPSSPRAAPPAPSRAVPAPALSLQPHHSLPLPQSQQVFRRVAAASRGTQFPPSTPYHPGPCPLTQVRSQLCSPRLVKLDHHAPFHALPSEKGSSRQTLDQRTFTEQVCECKDNGYLLSSKKIGSGAFSKVYLADATHERMHHNPKLSSDLQGKRHTMVRQAHLPPQGAPVPPSRPFRVQTHSGTIQLLWLPPPETLPSPISSPEASPGLLQADHPLFPNPLNTEYLAQEGAERSSLPSKGTAHPASPLRIPAKCIKDRGLPYHSQPLKGQVSHSKRPPPYR